MNPNDLNDLIGMTPLRYVNQFIWLTILLAAIIGLVSRRLPIRHRFCHPDLLASATFFNLCWHSIILITLGKNPIIARGSVVNVLAVVDAITLALLIAWIILASRKRISIE